MRRAGFVVLALSLWIPLAIAQEPNKVNVFVGYSYSNVNSFGFSNGNSLHLNGWEGTFEGRVYHLVGFVADISNRNGTLCGQPVLACLPSNVTIGQSDVLFGPRVSLPIGRLRPFAEGLFGYEHVTTNQFGPDRSFATALGGGLDYKLLRHVAWRFQGDFVHTSLFNAKQNNYRLSTGLVVRF
jgi:hypothetical protein